MSHAQFFMRTRSIRPKHGEPKMVACAHNQHLRSRATEIETCLKLCVGYQVVPAKYSALSKECSCGKPLEHHAE